MKSRLLRNYLFLFLTFLFIVSVNSCKKDRPDTDTQSSVDNSICEGEFSRLFSQTNNIAVNDSGVQIMGGDGQLFRGGCPDPFLDSVDNANGFPKTVFMTYGHDNDGDSICEVACTGLDGKTRRGIIRTVFSAHWSQPGAVVTHYLKNYYVDGVQFEGVVTMTRSVTSYTQVVSGGKCTKGSEWTISWNSSRTLTPVWGDTLTTNDDVIFISGSASGTDRQGRAFSVDIDPGNPLKRSICPYITQGIQTVKLEGKKDRTINYGDGTCDNIAVLTIDGNEFEFKLQ